MAQVTFEFSYVIHAPVDEVYAYFADPVHFARLSPLICSLHEVRYGRNAAGQLFFEYRSVESLHVAQIISYHNPIHVRATMTRINRQIVSDIDTRFRVRLHFVFDFRIDAESRGTRVHETTYAIMPALVQSYVVRKAQQMQHARVGILKSQLEPTPA